MPSLRSRHTQQVAGDKLHVVVNRNAPWRAGRRWLMGDSDGAMVGSTGVGGRVKSVSSSGKRRTGFMSRRRRRLSVLGAGIGRSTRLSESISSCM